MGAANGNSHPADRERDGVTAAKDTAMRDFHNRTFVYAQRPKPLCLIRREG